MLWKNSLLIIITVIIVETGFILSRQNLGAKMNVSRPSEQQRYLTYIEMFESAENGFTPRQPRYLYFK